MFLSSNLSTQIDLIDIRHIESSQLSKEKKKNEKKLMHFLLRKSLTVKPNSQSLDRLYLSLG